MKIIIIIIIIIIVLIAATVRRLADVVAALDNDRHQVPARHLPERAPPPDPLPRLPAPCA